MATPIPATPRKFLFIVGDSESIFFTSLPPTPSDLQSARAGVLAIVRLSDHYTYGRRAEWEPPVDGHVVVEEGEAMHIAPDRP